MYIRTLHGLKPKNSGAVKTFRGAINVLKLEVGICSAICFIFDFVCPNRVSGTIDVYYIICTHALETSRCT